MPNLAPDLELDFLMFVLLIAFFSKSALDYFQGFVSVCLLWRPATPAYVPTRATRIEGIVRRQSLENLSIIAKDSLHGLQHSFARCKIKYGAIGAVGYCAVHLLPSSNNAKVLGNFSARMA